MATGGRAERARSAVQRTCSTVGASADELLAALDADLQAVVPHDGAIWFGVDPVTMLATAPSRVRGMDDALCSTFWHLEFAEPDVARFTDLAQGDGVSALRMALDDRPARSIRYRECLVPQGYDDELRAVFRSGGTPWGAVALYRDRARKPFDDDDLAVVRAVSSAVADALRTHVRRAVPWVEQSSPGLLVIEGSGRVVSANAEALDWLRLLWPMSQVGDAAGWDPVDLVDLRDRSIGVATPLFALVAKALAVRDGRERGPVRLRLRDEVGRYVLLHASAMSGPGDTVAVVIESARSAEVAPIIIDAYAVTPREREVLAAIARGTSTADMAAEMFLSVHTVRDYVKTVFEKLEVSSRAELVARLFAEHYVEPLHAGMRHGN